MTTPVSNRREPENVSPACTFMFTFVLLLIGGTIGFFLSSPPRTTNYHPSALKTFSFAHPPPAVHRRGDVAIHAQAVGATYGEAKPDTSTMPRQLDYRTHGAVTPVKNQGACSSCWAVSATEAIESAFYSKYNHLQELSIQQTTQCSTLDVTFPIITTSNVTLHRINVTQFGEHYTLYVADTQQTVDLKPALYTSSPGSPQIVLDFSDITNLNSGSDVQFGQTIINRHSALNLIELGERRAVLAGCGGGAPHVAMEYFKTHSLIPSELYAYNWRIAAYNLSCSSPFCQAGCETTRMATYESIPEYLKLPVGYSVNVDHWGYVYPCWTSECANTWSDINVSRLVHALDTYGPLVITINAHNWVAYTGGIVSQDECSSDPGHADHSVVLVGYDLDNEYMIVKNSWGPFWGNKGYIHLSTRGNTCGMSNFALHVNVTSEIPSPD